MCLKLRFEDVPTGMCVKFKGYSGQKVEDGVLHKFHPLLGRKFYKDFVYNVSPDELVTVLLDWPMRTRLVLLANLLEPATVRRLLVKALDVVLHAPTRMLHAVAASRLNRQERNSMYEQARPLSERVVHARLQAAYERANGKNSTDVPPGAVSSKGLIKYGGYVEY